MRINLNSQSLLFNKFQPSKALWTVVVLWLACLVPLAHCVEVYCPVPCACKGTEVDCSNVTANSDSLPTQPTLHAFATHANKREFASVEILRLESANIEGPLTESLNITNLRELHLGHNRITEISPLTLSSLVHLERLDVSYNQLTAIPSTLFQHSTSLVYLNLSHNNIASIAEGAFSSLSLLTHLDLSHNPLGQIPKDVFTNLTNLRYLYLSHAQLSTLKSSFFKSSSQLVSIDVAYNSITTVDKNTVSTLAKLQYLQYLNISHNPLQCACKLDSFRKWLDETAVQTYATCGPSPHAGKLVHNVSVTHFKCPPAVTPTKRSTISYYDTKATIGPLIYNPQLGWYTGGVLSAMLSAFLVCVVLDRIKRYFVNLYKRQKAKRMKLKRKQQNTGDDLEFDGDLESLNSAVTPAEVAAAFHEQYLSVINYNHNHNQKSNLTQQETAPADNTSPRASDLERGNGAETSRSDYSRTKENSVQRNLIDPKTMEQEKIASKPRIESNTRLAKSPRHTDLSLPRVSTSSNDDNNGEELLGVTVLEVHPDCPIHSATANSRLLQTRLQEVM